MLTTEACNALLKTLEEPPKHVVFILATTEPQKILPTIHSRCQRFDFHPITQEEIVAHLQKVAEGSDIKADKEALELIAAASEGGKASRPASPPRSRSKAAPACTARPAAII